MIQASQDPALMEALLRRGNTPAEKRDINLGILRRMYPVGIFPTAVERYADTIEPVVEEPAPPPEPTRVSMAVERLQRKLPTAPPSRGLLSGFAPQAQGKGKQFRVDRVQDFTEISGLVGCRNDRDHAATPQLKKVQLLRFGCG